MGVEATDWNAAAASALDWWRDAGVDVLVDEAPHDWLAPVKAVEAPSPAPLLAVPAGAPGDDLPDRLDAFLAWRMGEAAPEATWRAVSIAASGPADAKVMVLVDCPDRDDGAAGLLMAGQTGVLFGRMLAAVGLDRASVHLTAVCARRPVAGRVAREVEARLAAVALHHVGLVAPERLLLLGNAASRALLATEIAAARGGLRALNHNGGTTDAVASFHPRLLIERPALKAEAWKDMQLLMKGMAR